MFILFEELRGNVRLISGTDSESKDDGRTCIEYRYGQRNIRKKMTHVSP